MSSGREKIYPLERRSLFVLSLLFSFCIIFGMACIVGYNSYTKAMDAAIRSNGIRATLLARLILENQKAAIGLLQSYARRPLLMESVKRKDFEGALGHLADLAKNIPEVEWPYIANPDSTVWVNFPVDNRVFNKDLSERDWYKGVSGGWKPYISSAYKMIVGERDLAVTVSNPIFDEKGKVIGILCAAQSAALFRKAIEEVISDSDAHMTLIDQKGQIVYSNRFAYTKEVIDYPSFDFVRRAMKGEKGHVEVQDFSDGNKAKYVSFAPIQGIGWSIIIEKAKSEVVKSEYSTFALIALISFLVYAVVALFLFYFRARQRQIRRLEKVNEELDGRVRERTAELEITNQNLKLEITERRQAGKALQASEARAIILSKTAGELLATDNPLGIVNELCRGVMAYLNCHTFFNFLAEEAIGRLHLNAWAGIPEEEARKIEWLDYGIAVCGCAARDGCRIVAEHIPTTPDVRTELVKSYGIKAYACHPLRGSGGKVIGTLSFGTRSRETFSEEDLTLMKAVTDQVAVAMERMRLISDLQRSRDELEIRVQERTAELKQQADLLDLARDAVVLEKIDGTILLWSDGAAEMYGWSKEEALGKIMRHLLKTEYPLPRVEIVSKLIRDSRWEGELTHSRKNGKKIEVLSRWTLKRDRLGNPESIMIINHDITERLKLEEQLRQAQKLEAIGTLTGGIAHDFNNILGAIVINSEMALFDLPGGSGLHTNLDLIHKSGLRGRDLVKQMLLFSRKSEKRQEIITLTPLIKETFKLLRSSLPTTIQMKLHLETESDTVSADPSQIQQVIMNLCTNAAYAMRGTTGSIDISLQGITFGSTDLPEADMQPGHYLILSVKDTGSGMDEEVKKRIFEPFFTTKPVGEGTGLGLSVAYGIVKGHKGNITVYSEPDKGSIFRVYLPKVDTGVSVAPETAKPIPRGNERILVVDDEEIIVTAAQNMLEHLGYKVTALMDSQEALRLFSEKPSEFDLVMTDQTMPFMNGEDLGKEVMRIRPDIPVILCTGYSDLISSEKATAMGFREYIMKPFTVREGAELVRRVLDQKEPSNSRKNP